MQNTTTKSKKRHICYVVMFLAILSETNCLAQSPAEISFSVSPGITNVNFKEALGYSDDFMLDWNQFHISVNGKVFLPSKGSFQVGAEVSWNQLYYAYYEFEHTPGYYFTDEYNVTTTGIMLLGRSCTKNFFIIFGAGIQIFKSGVAAAVSLEPGINIKLSENLYLPISLRVTPIFDDGTPIAVSGGLGLAYRFGN